jgi:hypothetical protein
MKTFKQHIKSFTTEEYRGSHKAPRKTNAAIHELDKVMPGVYEKDGWSVYGHGDSKLDKGTHKILAGLKGDEKKRVEVYRAVPQGTKGNINASDWVTPNRDYADLHGLTLDGKHIIQKKTVWADELHNDGNSIHEFGYNPREKKEKK